MYRTLYRTHYRTLYRAFRQEVAGFRLRRVAAAAEIALMERPQREVPVTAACVPNIGARGRARRLISGFGWTLASAALYAVFASRRAPTALFLVLAPFVAIAALSFFQVKEKT
jgi:hypothetical protein